MWFIVPGYHAIRIGNREEIWKVFGEFLWLFGNYWWMLGEDLHEEYPNDDAIPNAHTEQSSIILTFAIIWFGIYYLIVVPFNLLPVSNKALKEYDNGDIQPRFSYFRNYRQYENMHTFFWLAKVKSIHSL